MSDDFNINIHVERLSRLLLSSTRGGKLIVELKEVASLGSYLDDLLKGASQSFGSENDQAPGTIAIHINDTPIPLSLFRPVMESLSTLCLQKENWPDNNK